MGERQIFMVTRTERAPVKDTSPIIERCTPFRLSSTSRNRQTTADHSQKPIREVRAPINHPSSRKTRRHPRAFTTTPFPNVSSQGPRARRKEKLEPVQGERGGRGLIQGQSTTTPAAGKKEREGTRAAVRPSSVRYTTRCATVEGQASRTRPVARTAARRRFLPAADSWGAPCAAPSARGPAAVARWTMPPNERTRVAPARERLPAAVVTPHWPSSRPISEDPQKTAVRCAQSHFGLFFFFLLS